MLESVGSTKILGVVNSVQPVGGAPVVYRRFRAGTEVAGMLDIPGAALATIIGWDAADITCVMANAPGPLELLPTKHYRHDPYNPVRSGWLKVERDTDKGRELLFDLPKVDPYEEIYGKTAQEVWWGLIDETLIDPAEMAKVNKLTPVSAYNIALRQAKKFHDTVGLYCHPNTYAHYGADRKEDSFGTVHWTTKSKLPEVLQDGHGRVRAEHWTKLGTATIGLDQKVITFKLENKEKPRTDDDWNAGDGTVPVESAALIKDQAKHIFRMKGFDHAASYKNDNVIENVLYCLGKIIQGATHIKDLPQNKGEPCPDPAATSVNNSSDSDAQPSPVFAS
jgi:hypothetical protein